MGGGRWVAERKLAGDGKPTGQASYHLVDCQRMDVRDEILTRSLERQIAEGWERGRWKRGRGGFLKLTDMDRSREKSSSEA